MVEALGGRIEAVGEGVAGDAAGVVGRVAVVEAVGQDEVEDLVGQVVAQRVPGQRYVLGVGRLVADVDRNGVRR